MRSVLLVEDDRDIQEVNQDMLERRGGYNVRLAANLAEARERVAESAPDIIVLDITLPDGNGLDFLRELRRDADIPVLLLTALGKSIDMVKGLQAGGDDYLAKPYENDVLLARIEALLRRAERVPENVVKGALTLKPPSMTALLHGKDILLTQKEFALLLLFAQNEDKTMSVEYIYEKVWGQDMNSEVRALKLQISNLRGKIADSGYVITAVRNAGYRFEMEQ